MLKVPDDAPQEHPPVVSGIDRWDTDLTLGGRYQVGQVLGYGTLTAVHRAHDVQWQREVAVKIPRRDHCGDLDTVRRLHREAQTHTELTHPGIVTVLDSGIETTLESGAEVPYLVLELINGTTLRELLETIGLLEVDEALRITGDVLAAVAYSHQRGIAHQDVSAGNVMLDVHGRVKLLDFGSAHNTAQSMMTQDMTATPEYVSPEHARGLATDARTDVYSVGCLLYQLLTGHTPFSGDSPVSLAYQHVHELPVPPSQRRPEIGTDIDAIVSRALAKPRSARYQHAEEFGEEIRAARLRRRPVA